MLCDNPEGWRGWVGAGLQREGIYVYRGVSLGAQLVKSPPAVWETWFDPWVGKIPWRRERLPVFWSGEFHALYSPWGCKELDTTEQFSLSLHLSVKQQGQSSHPLCLRASPTHSFTDSELLRTSPTMQYHFYGYCNFKLLTIQEAKESFHWPRLKEL